jgi:hypothetical protein
VRVRLTEQTVADYADTVAYLGAGHPAVPRHLRTWACSAAKAKAWGKRAERSVRTATGAADRSIALAAYAVPRHGKRRSSSASAWVPDSP